jgi:dipeptidyl aminopeptidase/acylaminoacyl peptidase
VSTRGLAAVFAVAAAASTTGAAARPGASGPLLAFSAGPAIIGGGFTTGFGLCATDLQGHTFRLTDPREDWSPSWSPDGRSIAFLRANSDPAQRGIIVADEQGQTLRNVDVTGRFNVSGPVWSPAGNEFAFVVNSPWFSEIWGVDLAAPGPGERKLVEAGGAYLGPPSWSPDGARVLFTKSSDSFGVGVPATYVVDADGTNERKLLDWALGPIWSPDGRQFAYVAIDSQNWRIAGLAVARADGSDPRLLTRGDAAAPAWSPDGSTIAFTRASGTAFQIGLIRPDGTDEHIVAPGGGTLLWTLWGPPYLYRPTAVWSPDGSTIAFTRETQSARRVEITVIRSDGTGELTFAPGGYPTGTPTWRPSGELPSHRRPCVVSGTARGDVIRGTRRGDVIAGGAGNDRISAAGGPDVLIGGRGHDRLYGGGGFDFFFAKDGKPDDVSGGPGIDSGSFDLGRDRLASIEHRR